MHHDPFGFSPFEFLLRVFDDYEVAYHVDHAADSWRVIVDRDIVRAAETKRLDRALLVLERIADAAGLTDDDLLSFCHDRISYLNLR